MVGPRITGKLSLATAQGSSPSTADAQYSSWADINYVKTLADSSVSAAIEAGLKRISNRIEAVGEDKVPHYLSYLVGILALKDYKEKTAERCFDLALKAHPSFMPAQVARAECLFKRGKFEQAWSDLAEISFFNGRPEYETLRAMMIYAAGQEEHANQCIAPIVKEATHFSGRPRFTSRIAMAIQAAIINAEPMIEIDSVRKLTNLEIPRADMGHVVTLARALKTLNAPVLAWETDKRQNADKSEQHAAVVTRRAQKIVKLTAGLWNTANEYAVLDYSRGQRQDQAPEPVHQILAYNRR
ncbi:MAG: hypothetical protein AAF569_02080 [Pseudomonadota bacterium]